MILDSFPLNAIAIRIVLQSQNAIDAISARTRFAELSGWRVSDDRHWAAARRRSGAASARIRAAATTAAAARCNVVCVLRLLRCLIPYDPTKQTNKTRFNNCEQWRPPTPLIL